MKHISIALAIAGLFTGLIAARYWYKASIVPVDPDWETEPADIEGLGSLRGWSTATLVALIESSNLNKTAALWTAAAVVFSTLSSLVGSLV